MNNQNNFMIVQGENLDENQLLGKFVYYSLADVLVDKDDFTRILPVHGTSRMPRGAFRSWTHSVTRPVV